jgi:hypothetical protein
MANAPAQKVGDLSVEGLDPTTPEFQHKERLIAQAEKRKKETKVIKQWMEIVRFATHKKGGKVSMVKVTNNGYKHRLYLGRETQVAVQIKAAQKAGLEVKYR